MKSLTILILVNFYGVLLDKSISQDEDTELLSAATNIIDVCFGVSGQWPDLLFAEDISNHIFQWVHEYLKHSVFTVNKKKSNLIWINDTDRSFADLVMRYNDFYVKTRGKPIAVIMYLNRIDDLELVLKNLKISAWRTWSSKIYYLVIVPKIFCNTDDSNQILKLFWEYWILNAVVLCPSSDNDNRNQSEIELYTHNPYSYDHSRRWKDVVQEKIDVHVSTESFRHSWYIFNKKFIDLKSFEECGDLFFDKTLNLDGYVVPISIYLVRPKILLDEKKSGVAKWIGPDGLTLQTLTKKLNFDVVEVPNNTSDRYGQFENFSYTGVLKDAFYGVSNLVASGRYMLNFPGLEISYPHASTGVCFASRISGFYPQWTNIFAAKYIWVVLGFGILIVTLILHLQNKSEGLMSAYLDAERFITGTSILRIPTMFKYRIALSSIFLAFVVIDSIFRGRLVSILAIARRYPDLNTVEQLKEEGVDVYGYGPFKNLIEDPILRSRFHSVLPKECLETVERDRHQRACLAHCLTLPALISNTTSIHQASNPIKEYHAVYVATINWPMMDRWNYDMQKLVEAGVITRWRVELHRGLEINSWKFKRMVDSPGLKAIKPSDFLSAFVLLFVGLTTALIAFIWEIRRN